MIKLRDLIKESHTISFTKDEMGILHRGGQLKKDGHLYVYDESANEAKKKKPIKLKGKWKHNKLPWMRGPKKESVAET